MERNTLKPSEAEFGDASAFTYGALHSMAIAYVPRSLSVAAWLSAGDVALR